MSKIGHDNILTAETITVSTEAAGFEKENAYDGLPIDYWKPSASPAWLKATGTMPVGMWLADNVAESLVGAELVTNGDFPTDTTGWTASGGAILSIDTARLKVLNDGTGTGNGSAYQIITTVVGSEYIITVTGERNGGSHLPRLQVGGSVGNSDNVNYQFVAPDTPDTKMVTFVATLTATYVTVTNNSVTASVSSFFDDISVRLADPDLSANDNGLGVYGTVTKTAVGDSGLVSYSGFSSSNYLEQPYNADMDFGTGEWSYSGWVKDDEPGSGTDYIFDWSYWNGAAYVGSGIRIITTTSGVVSIRITDDGWASQDAIDSTTVIRNSGEWHFLNVKRSGNDILLSVDGVLETTVTLAAAILSLSNANATLRFGLPQLGGSGQLTNGSLTLWRAFDYAPTAAQILDIYNKEKHYFKSGGTLPTTLLSTSATTADYFAMYAHDFAGTGSSVVLEYSDDDSVWVEAFAPLYPATSAPVFKTFTQSSHKYWRVYTTGAVQQIGAVNVGVALDTQRGVSIGFAPMSLGSENMPIGSESTNGEFLGRTTKKRPIKTSINFKNLTHEWMRQYYPELLSAMENRPFFALPSDVFDEEAAYCWTDKDIKTPTYSDAGYMGFSIKVKARIT